MRSIKLALAACLGLALAMPSAVPAATASQPREAVRGSHATSRRAPYSDLARKRDELRAKYRRTKPSRQSPLMPKDYAVERLDKWVVEVAEGERASAQRAVAAVGGDVLRVARRSDRMLVSLPGGTEQLAASRLKSTDAVLDVRRAALVRASETRSDSVGRSGVSASAALTSDPALPRQWGLDRIGMNSVWPIEIGSSEVTVAVIDTGVDLTHPDLIDNIDTDNDFDFVNNDTSARDDHGHGTHVAGTVAAATNDIDGVGVAPGCTILPVKVLDSRGRGSDFDVAEGIVWATDHGASVISMSLGTWAPTQALVDAVEYAQARDVVIVAAAGNSGWYMYDDGAASIEYPGALPGVLTVGASTLNDTVVSWSSKGPELDLVAPGCGILSSRRGGGMMEMTGTSMATPFAAGAVALVRSAHPEYTAQQAMSALTTTAKDVGRAGRDIESGYGRLNVAAALGQPGGTDSEPSVPTDDDIRGVPLPASTTTGTLDIDLDSVDVYRVHLAAGQKLKANLRSDPGTSYRVALFDPTVKSVYSGYPIESDWFDYYYYDSSASMEYTAPREADFYLAAIASRGKGGYTLTSSVTTPTPSDNDFPGVPLTSSPMRGSVDSRRDDSDMYRVTLQKGDRLAVKLIGPKPKRGEVYFYCDLYPMDAWSWWDTTEEAEWYWYPGLSAKYESYFSQGFQYVAPETGEYFLNVGSYWGAGPYALDWRILNDAEDDQIPGIRLGSSPATGTLNAPFDMDDVYKIHADEGQRINVKIQTKGWMDCEVGLYGANATDMDSWWVAGDWQMFSYVVPTDGAYYVDVWAPAGSGSYTLTWSLTDHEPARVEASVDTTRPAYGKVPTIDVNLTSQESTAPVADQVVALQEWWWGWETVESAMSDSAGHVRFKPELTSATAFRVVTTDGFDEAEIGPDFAVKPGVFLSRPVPSSTVTSDKTVKWSGVLRPRHYRGGKTVKLLFSKLVNNKWEFRKRVVATNVANVGASSAGSSIGAISGTRYSAPYKIPSRGRWRVVAITYEDEDHLAGQSSATYVTVK
ncbi:MAG: peptidase S8 [Coriobacteriales bacterium]|nr:peptidase S8 [Coriobacteriales bacterium]